MASSQDKILEFHISRLKDKNPEVVKKTIKELVLMEDRAAAALPALEELFRTAEDPEVKKAAQQAGFVIYTKTKESQK